MHQPLISSQVSSALMDLYASDLLPGHPRLEDVAHYNIPHAASSCDLAEDTDQEE